MGGLDTAGIRADLDAVAADTDGLIRVREARLETDRYRRRGTRSAPDALAPRRLGRAIPRDWRIASYSWLAGGAEPERPDYDAGAPGGDEPDDRAPARGETDGIFLFPRGIQAGHFLHALFEELDFPTAGGDGLASRAVALLDRFGLDPSWEPVVSRTVTRVLDTGLDAAGGFRLRDLATDQRLNELEFYFPLEGMDPLMLRRCLDGFSDYGSAVRGLTFESVRGFMKGYIDLVFRAGGRWFVADYKSNHLGDRAEDYDRGGLAGAIRAHRYDLQYLIYTLALHRYLGLRLPGYDYDTHFGGVYYLFLRGMRPHSGRRYGVFFDRPPVALIDALDNLFAGGVGDRV
jgi:exodeoxyribonuclease V beta subunit